MVPCTLYIGDTEGLSGLLRSYPSLSFPLPALETRTEPSDHDPVKIMPCFITSFAAARANQIKNEYSIL